MLSDRDLLVNRFISVPSDMGQKHKWNKASISQLIGDLNCGAFVAGIVKAVLTGANFVSFAFDIRFSS